MDITLEDVEIALKVLNEFMRRSREATITLRRMDLTFKTSSQKVPSSMQDFVNMAFQTAQDKKKAQEGTEPETLIEPPSEADLQRMKDIREKAKARAP